ncbi:MAG: GntR family transcriptional regulator [Geminicoccaceae bacterium]
MGMVSERSTNGFQRTDTTGPGADGELFRDALTRHRDQGPLYRQLTQSIADLIASGSLSAGSSLPSERDLARATGISRVTVRKAIQSLVHAGQLVQKQGSGTYVASNPSRFEQPLRHLTSFTEDMSRRGMICHSRWLSRGLHAPSNDELMMLGLSISDQVARLSRIRYADKLPIAIERSSLPGSVLPDPEAVDQSLYRLLDSRGTRPTRAIQRISAINATPRDAELLEILVGDAVLKVERISYLASGQTVELTRSLYRGDAYDFVSELK